jgi:hypothetical protein
MTTLVIVMVCSGCGDKPVCQPPQQTDPRVKEAQTHFTYRGRTIPPFFLADFCGGPDAPEFHTSGMGCRISTVFCSGLVLQT